jgi:putative spermidine/putrescine transport system permease protein
VIITAITVVLGFPIAYIIARSGPRLRLVLLIMTILPLMTSVVIRTFGWVIVLSRGGPLTDILHAAGLVERNFALLYTETGIVLAMVQVLLPFMAITTLGAISAIDTRIEEAARTMGCSFWRSLWHVVLPLSIPGIVSGSLLVFALSINSFVTPSLVGGVRLPVLAWSIYQQATSTLDWHFAAAQSVFLLLLVMAIIIPYLALMRRKNG